MAEVSAVCSGRGSQVYSRHGGKLFGGPRQAGAVLLGILGRPSASYSATKSLQVLARGERRLVVRNGASRHIEPTVVRVGSVFPLIGSPSTNAVENGSHRARAAIISLMLCAEAGGGSTILGGGMTEATALGLLRDVSRILSLT